MNIYNKQSNFIEERKSDRQVVLNQTYSRQISAKLGVSTLLLATVALLLSSNKIIAQQVLPVRIDRWLEIQQVSGTVTEVIGGVSQAARVSSRLQNVGDAVRTGNASSAVLAVDTAIGAIDVAENTSIEVSELTLLPTGGRITRLEVTGGQVRLELRRFTDPDSELEIKTPAGISGVRGTTFGVSVQPNGQTGVATIDGSVSAAAQGQQVTVDAGLQSLIIPGEPPTPPEPLRDDPRLDIQVLQRSEPQTVQIVGQTDSVNLLVINDAPQNLERSGEFDLHLPVPDDRRIVAIVTTPLGTRQTYELVIP